MFSKLEIVLSSVILILLIITIGTTTLYTQANQQTITIATLYNQNINQLIQECKIDLNELNQKRIEHNRCDIWKRLYQSKTIDSNFYKDQNCGITL